jgi:hypothetical protein
MSAVNSDLGVQVNRTLSRQGLAVLRLLAPARASRNRYPVDLSAGELAVADLVQQFHQRGRSLPVTRASLSRTLRRLWRDGLVELSSTYGWQTMTERHQKQVEWLEAQAADPLAAYESYKALVGEDRDSFRSAEAYIVMLRKKVRRGPDLRVTRVRITAVGRTRLTAACVSELTDAPRDVCRSIGAL